MIQNHNLVMTDDPEVKMTYSKVASVSSPGTVVPTELFEKLLSSRNLFPLIGSLISFP